MEISQLQSQLTDAQVEIHELHETLHNAEATDQDNRAIIAALQGMLADRNNLIREVLSHLTGELQQKYLDKFNELNDVNDIQIF